MSQVLRAVCWYTNQGWVKYRIPRTSWVPRSPCWWGTGIGRGTLPPTLWYGTTLAGPKTELTLIPDT